jgi:DnaJ-class molecular chaperone
MTKDRSLIEPASGFREVSLARSFDTFAPSFDEIFDRLWSNFDLLTRPKAERLESLTVDVPLAEEKALAGGSEQILVPARVTCQRCHGHGSIGLYECWHCQGHGSVTAEFPLEVSYPAGLGGDHVVRVRLDELGIHNYYLTVRFRPTAVC